MNKSVKQLSSTQTGALSSEEQFSPSRYRSPLRYPGGKQKAIDKIFQVFPKNAHEYREPLIGGGSVYLQAKSIDFAKHYWINDKFKELISFWKIVQDPTTCNKLIEDLRKLLLSFSNPDEIKEFYLNTKKEIPDSQYREALLFFFFNRVTFSGTTRAGGFSSAASIRRFTVSSIERLLPMPVALANAKITNLDFEDLINKPGDDVFLFLDPPYYTASKLYGHGGSLHSFDHSRLAHALKKTQHRFLVTYDDCAEIRNLYSWAQIKNWSLQYGMNNCSLNKQSKVGAELFICNY